MIMGELVTPARFAIDNIAQTRPAPSWPMTSFHKNPKQNWTSSHDFRTLHGRLLRPGSRAGILISYLPRPPARLDAPA
jgi:hypothetical protein